MENKDYPKGHRQDKIALLINFIKYIISLLFLFAGLVGLYIGETLAGLCSILMGIISIPLIADAIKKKVGASGSLLLTILIALYLLRWVSQ
jgi:TM2 domain-containing membrane protein YozV